jgi:RNA polymerase sigma-70 factor (ECF subfamily)
MQTARSLRDRLLVIAFHPFDFKNSNFLSIPNGSWIRKKSLSHLALDPFADDSAHRWIRSAPWRCEIRSLRFSTNTKNALHHGAKNMSDFNRIDYSIHSVAELVAASLAGDRDAFGELFQRHERQVFAIAYRRLSDRDEADEMVQEVFIQAWRKLSQLSQAEAFSGWLRQITVRMSINRGTRRAKLALIDQEILEATAESGQDAQAELVREETRKRLHEQLAQLKELDRATLVAYYIEEQSMLQMAEHFGAPVGTIKRRLHTARQRLAVACQDLAAC